YAELHQARRALTVAGDLLRQIDAQRLERRPELRGIGRVSIDRIATAGAVREKENGVARAGVAVDRDKVERPVYGLAERCLQEALLDGRVGREEGEHSRHVRVDHPRALTTATERIPADP